LNELDISLVARVLDIPCGYGRHALRIANQVEHVTGIDRTAKFIERAKELASDQKISNVDFLIGDMREIDFDAEYDAAYNYFTSWGYWDDDTNHDVLRRICKALKPGGGFLLEMMHRDSLLRNFRVNDWRDIDEDTVLLEDNHFDCESGRLFNTRRYISTVNAGTIEEFDVELRLPTASEFIRMFLDAGFSEARVIEAPTGKKLTIDSKRIAVIGMKPK
jgi:SAM-dependent methyltransferase